MLFGENGKDLGYIMAYGKSQVYESGIDSYCGRATDMGETLVFSPAVYAWAKGYCRKHGDLYPTIDIDVKAPKDSDYWDDESAGNVSYATLVLYKHHLAGYVPMPELEELMKQ